MVGIRAEVVMKRHFAERVTKAHLSTRSISFAKPGAVHIASLVIREENTLFVLAAANVIPVIKPRGSVLLGALEDSVPWCSVPCVIFSP